MHPPDGAAMSSDNISLFVWEPSDSRGISVRTCLFWGLVRQVRELAEVRRRLTSQEVVFGGYPVYVPGRDDVFLPNRLP